MTFATSRNLTWGGVGVILVGIGKALVEYQTAGLAGINWSEFYTVVVLGIFAIFAKGAASTGGTVDGKGTPVTDPAPPTPTP